ncbi:unnamed protein product, partial [Nesidiocoris tenuis]
RYQALLDDDTWLCRNCGPTPPAPLDSSEFSKFVIDDQNPAFKRIGDTLNQITCSLSELQRSVQYQSSQYDEFYRDMKSMQLENARLNKDMTSVKEDVKRLDMDGDWLKKRVNHLEQTMIANELEINGIPGNFTGNVFDILNKICDLIKIKIEEQDVIDIRRINSDRRQRGNSPTIVVFRDRSIRQKILDSRKSIPTLTLKDVGVDLPDLRRKRHPRYSQWEEGFKINKLPGSRKEPRFSAKDQILSRLRLNNWTIWANPETRWNTTTKGKKNRERTLCLERSWPHKTREKRQRPEVRSSRRDTHQEYHLWSQSQHNDLLQRSTAQSDFIRGVLNQKPWGIPPEVSADRFRLFTVAQKRLVECNFYPKGQNLSRILKRFQTNEILSERFTIDRSTFELAPNGCHGRRSTPVWNGPLWLSTPQLNNRRKPLQAKTLRLQEPTGRLGRAKPTSIPNIVLFSEKRRRTPKTTDVESCRFENQVCVKECPSESWSSLPYRNNIQRFDARSIQSSLVCVDDRVKSTVTTVQRLTEVINNRQCADWYISSRPLYGRCLNLVGSLTQLNRPNLNDGLSSYQLMLSGWIKNRSDSDQYIEVMGKVIDDLYKSWRSIVVVLVITILVSLLYITLLRWIAGIMTWLSLIALLALLITCE